MGKAGKIIGGIIGGLVAVGAAVAIFSAVSNMGGGFSEETKLATVQHVDYDYPKDIISWDEVYGADSYNVSINDKVESVKKAYYTVNLDKDATEFTVKVQACDSTGYYASSDWSEPFVITVDQEDIVNKVDKFAQSIPGSNMDLQKVVSMHAVDNVLYTTAVFKDMGKNYVYTYNSAYNDTITSLDEALNMGVQNSTYAENYYLAKDYDTASSFLAREEKSEKMQELEDAGYQVSFVTSQAFEEGKSTVGLKGILKATNKYDTSDIKYYSVDFAIGVPETNVEGYKYTTAVKNTPASYVLQHSFIELTGDFAEYAKEVEANQKTNNISNDLGMSY